MCCQEFCFKIKCPRDICIKKEPHKHHWAVTAHSYSYRMEWVDVGLDYIHMFYLTIFQKLDSICNLKLLPFRPASSLLALNFHCETVLLFMKTTLCYALMNCMCYVFSIRSNYLKQNFALLLLSVSSFILFCIKLKYAQYTKYSKYCLNMI